MDIDSLYKLKPVHIKIIQIMLQSRRATVEEVQTGLAFNGIFLNKEEVRRCLDKLVRIGVLGKKKERFSIGDRKKVLAVYSINRSAARSKKFVEVVKKLWEDFMNWHYKP